MSKVKWGSNQGRIKGHDKVMRCQSRVMSSCVTKIKGKKNYNLTDWRKTYNSYVQVENRKHLIWENDHELYARIPESFTCLKACSHNKASHNRQPISSSLAQARLKQQVEVHLPAYTGKHLSIGYTKNNYKHSAYNVQGSQKTTTTPCMLYRSRCDVCLLVKNVQYSPGYRIESHMGLIEYDS